MYGKWVRGSSPAFRSAGGKEELGPVPFPLPVAINRSPWFTASAVGYHSVGMNPMADWGDELLWSAASVNRVISKTATAFADASATNKRDPSAVCANALG